MANRIIYRCATVEDSDSILEIYRPYVESTTVTFETVVPSREEFRHRMEGILEKYPYLVAEADGTIVGYSYASAYRPRAGFGWTAELSVYVRQDLRKMGIGSHLFAAMLDFLRLQGYQNAVSVLSWPNLASEKLHYRFGFRCAGVQLKCGFKNGTWCDVAVFERRLGDYAEPPAPPLPFTSLDPEQVKKILSF